VPKPLRHWPAESADHTLASVPQRRVGSYRDVSKTIRASMKPSSFEAPYDRNCYSRGLLKDACAETAQVRSVTRREV
jgi:hypothetical protein